VIEASGTCKDFKVVVTVNAPDNFPPRFVAKLVKRRLKLGEDMSAMLQEGGDYEDIDSQVNDLTDIRVQPAQRTA